jgi:hypothetical protein
MVIIKESNLYVCFINKNRANLQFFEFFLANRLIFFLRFFFERKMDGILASGFFNKKDFLQKIPAKR